MKTVCSHRGCEFNRICEYYRNYCLWREGRIVDVEFTSASPYICKLLKKAEDADKEKEEKK
jgi:hypothetical protein